MLSTSVVHSLNEARNTATPISRWLRTIIETAMDAGVRTIHISAMHGGEAQVQYRLADGLHTIYELPDGAATLLVERIHILSGGGPDAHSAFDGVFFLHIDEESVEVRAHFQPTVDGLHLVMHLDHASAMTMSDLGIHADTQRSLQELIAADSGLFFVSGSEESLHHVLPAIARYAAPHRGRIVTSGIPVTDARLYSVGSDSHDLSGVAAASKQIGADAIISYLPIVSGASTALRDLPSLLALAESRIVIIGGGFHHPADFLHHAAGLPHSTAQLVSDLHGLLHVSLLHTPDGQPRIISSMTPNTEFVHRSVLHSSPSLSSLRSIVSNTSYGSLRDDALRMADEHHIPLSVAIAAGLS